jgi:hypothetical protein
MPGRCLLALAFALLLALPVRAEPVHFDREVAPVLVRWCLDCHSGAKPRGGLDLSRARGISKVVVPGKIADSELWKLVADGKMPPKKPLPESARALLKVWIEQGAKWGTDPIDPLAFSTDHRAGRDWWSLQPIRRPDLPAVKEVSATRNPLDRFLLASLERAGKTFAPEADRRTLLRRLSFDLTGLPPTFEEVTAFVNDPRPDAYERQVDRLLTSPAYGERWARHWLDIVRYGESNGFERDLPRENAWPYRDWIIGALNADLPYDEFARMQLAGDILRPRDPDGVRATGFLVAGPHDTVVPVVERMRQAMAQDELEDLLGSIGQTFLGLTVNCARCHDHKFDPISTRDYYSLVAVFAGATHGERALPSVTLARLTENEATRTRLREELVALEAPARKAILLARQQALKLPPAPVPLAEWDFRESLKDKRGGLHLSLVDSAKRDETGLIVDGRGYAQSPPLTAGLKEKTLEAWVKLASLDQRGGGVLSVQTLDGNVFDSIVFGEREPRRWMAGSDGFRRTQSSNGTEEKAVTQRPVHIAIVYQADGTISVYRDGTPYGSPYKSSGPTVFEAEKAQVIFGLRHGPAGGNKHLTGTIVEARLYDRALSASEVAASAGHASDYISEAELLAEFAPVPRARWKELSAKLTETERTLADLGKQPQTKMYSAVPVPIPPTRILNRGNVADPGDPVVPGTPVGVRVPGFTESLSPTATEGERRAWFARWLTHPTNPLFPRVIVNRLWQYHLGGGLVETTSDLGFHGGQPTDAALLDYLASELIASGYRLKPLHRLIVTSAAYRQALSPDRPLQRLEAESIRDAMLSAAGLLDRRMGGPGYLDVKSYFFKGTQFYDPLDQVGPTFHRRTIYRFSPRSGRSPYLDTFDCPDPSTATPRRARTTTPLQALAQLNNASIFYIAEQLERRALEAGDNPTTRVTVLYQRLFQRSPRREELAVVLSFVERHGLAALARVLLNSNEFLHVE